MDAIVKGDFADSNVKTQQWSVGCLVNIHCNKFVKDLEPGISGFLITCNTSKEKEKFAVFEAYTLLNEYADELYGPESCQGDEETKDDITEEDEDEAESIEETLNKEIKAIKEQTKQERRFQSVKSGVKNVLFIKTTIPDPNELVHKIFSDLQEKNTKKTRYCLKLLPVKSTCYASLEKLKKQIQPIIEDEFLRDDILPVKFKVEFKARCNGTIKKDDVTLMVSKMILDGEKGHKVEYNDPDCIINVDIIRNVCAFGILKDFLRFKKYNLHSIVEAEIKEEARDEQKEETAPVADKTSEKINEQSYTSDVTNSVEQKDKNLMPINTDEKTNDIDVNVAKETKHDDDDDE